MRSLSATICFAIVLLSAVPGHLAAQATSLAKVTVEVTNKTAGGASVEGDEVALEVFRHEQPLRMLEVKVGEDGKAVFEDVPTGPHVQALARVRHQNMSFRSHSVALDAEAGPFSVPATVYDVSSDRSVLSGGTHHLMIGQRDATLLIREYLQLRNPSDRAVTSSERDAQDRPIVLKFDLPEGFEDFVPSDYLASSSLLVTADGFYDTLAVPPGEHQVAFSYRVPIEGSVVELTRRLSLPTTELAVFWEQSQGRLEGLGEPDSRLANDEGVPIEYYRRADLKGGSEVTFRVTGLAERASNSNSWAVLVIAFVLVTVVVLWRLRSRPAAANSDWPPQAGGA